MATTQEILDAATQLGKMVGTHEVSAKLERAVKALQEDVEAQRLLSDYHRHLDKIGQKEAKGQPIEVEDKRRLEQLQKAVASSGLLREFQIRQMDFLDLMRQVDEAIMGPSQAAVATGVPGTPPISS